MNRDITHCWVERSLDDTAMRIVRCLPGLLILTLLLDCGMSNGAGWDLLNPADLSTNRESTVTLIYDGTRPVQDNDWLWIGTSAPGEVIAPERVKVSGGQVAFPAFLRRDARDILVYDPVDKGVTSFTVSSTGGGGDFAPLVDFAGTIGIAVVHANSEVTPTLTLNGGSGNIPASAHIAAYDHRGRMVAGRFYNTFDVVAGTETFRIPAAGYYEVRLGLYEEPVTSMPRALQRGYFPIPFGTSLADEQSSAAADPLVEWETVVGTRLTVEKVPTTATLLAEDRMKVAAVTGQSNMASLNKWPFVIDSATDGQRNGDEAKLIRLHKMMGSTFVPLRLRWSDMQTGPNSFNWGVLHKWLTSYRKSGVRPILWITGTNRWNGEKPGESVESLLAWGRMVRQIGNQFRPMIWGLNYAAEFDEGEDNGERTGGIEKLVEVTAANFLDKPGGGRHGGPPITLAVTSSTKEFLLSDTVSRRTFEDLQGISLNLKYKDVAESPESNELRNQIKTATLMLKNGEGGAWRGLTVENVGWPTGPRGVEEKEQANYLVRAHVLGLVEGANKLVWSTLVDWSGAEYSSGGFDLRGLLRGNLTPKPAAAAYNVMAYMLSGVTFIRETKQGAASIYEFDLPVQTNKWRGTVYVTWTESPGKFQDVLLDMKHGGGVYALDYLGAEIPVAGSDGKTFTSLTGLVKIPVGFEPVFIWDAGKAGSR